MVKPSSYHIFGNTIYYTTYTQEWENNFFVKADPFDGKHRMHALRYVVFYGPFSSHQRCHGRRKAHFISVRMTIWEYHFFTTPSSRADSSYQRKERRSKGRMPSVFFERCLSSKFPIPFSRQARPISHRELRAFSVLRRTRRRGLHSCPDPCSSAQCTS